MYCHGQTGELGKVKEGNILPRRSARNCLQRVYRHIAIRSASTCRPNCPSRRSPLWLMVPTTPARSPCAVVRKNARDLTGGYNACQCGFPGKASPLDIGGYQIPRIGDMAKFTPSLSTPVALPPNTKPTQGQLLNKSCAYSDAPTLQFLRSICLTSTIKGMKRRLVPKIKAAVRSDGSALISMALPGSCGTFSTV